MSCNYIEDQLISRIDADRAGVDWEEVEQEAALNVGRLGLVIRGLAAAIDSAGKFQEMADRDLFMALQAVSFLEIQCRSVVENLVKTSGFTPRRIKWLPKTDPLRLKVEAYEARMRALEIKRRAFIDCFTSRKFLKEQNALLEVYLEARGMSRKIDVCMKRLEKLYPAH